MGGLTDHLRDHVLGGAGDEVSIGDLIIESISPGIIHSVCRYIHTKNLRQRTLLHVLECPRSVLSHISNFVGEAEPNSPRAAANVQQRHVPVEARQLGHRIHQRLRPRRVDAEEGPGRNKKVKS